MKLYARTRLSLVFDYQVTYTAGSKDRFNSMGMFEDPAGVGNGFIVSTENGAMRVFKMKRDYDALVASAAEYPNNAELVSEFYSKNDVIQAVYVNVGFGVAIDTSNRIVWWNAQNSAADLTRPDMNVDDPAPAGVI